MARSRQPRTLPGFARCAALALLATCGGAWAATDVVSHAAVDHARPESRLVAAMTQAWAGDYLAALADLDALLQARPDFRLARFLYGELLLARAGRALPQPFVERVLADPQAQARRHALLEEARLRWQHRLEGPPRDAVPAAVLRLAPRYRHVIVVDLRRNRLYVFENDDGMARLVADFYASIGAAGVGKQFEGDLRTPVGVYRVTEYLPDDSLPELYGVGAFPVNYPNAWDRYFGRTGDGIWVHGVPRDTYNRAPLASEGCVVLANEDFAALRAYMRPGVTPVVLTADLQWLTREQARAQQGALMAALGGWRSDWEHAGASGGRDYYADSYVSARGMNNVEFVRDQRAVGLGDADVDIKLEDISLFQYPGEPNLALVSFTQVYRGNNFDRVLRRQQYWRRDGEQGWQIVHETLAPPPGTATAAR